MAFADRRTRPVVSCNQPWLGAADNLYLKPIADGTVIWTLPDGQIHVTTPGSALLFPALRAPTGTLPGALRWPIPATAPTRSQ